MSTSAPQSDLAHLDNCLVGTLANWPLNDLLLWMHNSKRTGMVRVGVGLDAGVVFFREGQLFRCEWGGTFGEPALLELLSIEDGAFSLIQRGVPDARTNIARPTAELLLQCTIALDEDRRATTAQASA